MSTVEDRLTDLEQKVDQLLNRDFATAEPWWSRWLGVAREDPTFEEAVRLGAEYRRSQPNPVDSPDAVEL
jgi:hypothetical protein